MAVTLSSLTHIYSDRGQQLGKRKSPEAQSQEGKSSLEPACTIPVLIVFSLTGNSPRYYEK